MPAEAVEVTATYENIPVVEPETYTVTVNNGSGDGEYEEGATVTITADAAPSGKQFAGWNVVSGNVTLKDAKSATTTFVMPAKAVVVTATYKDIPVVEPETYTVTVNNGSGDGKYKAGATVTITADAAPSGKQFKEWTVESGNVTLKDAKSATTTFTMPAKAVVVTAVYEDVPTEPTTDTKVEGGTSHKEVAENGTVVLTFKAENEKTEGNNVSVGGKLSEDSYIVVKPEINKEAQQMFEQKKAENKVLSTLVDISVVGEYEGALTVTIPVDAKYNGKDIRVFHYVNNTVEIHTATVADGKVTIKVSSLSPFAVELPDLSADTDKNTTPDANKPQEKDETPAKKEDAPKTGDVSGTAMWFTIALAASAAAIAALRKKRA